MEPASLLSYSVTRGKYSFINEPFQVRANLRYGTKKLVECQLVPSSNIIFFFVSGERTEAMQRDAGYISSGSDVSRWSGLLLPLSWFLILA